ncbi:hypothetical protein M3T53_03550 [Actinomyces sp. B33]|uniref:hypothetical protein n=1 Tax=Actinomyces sp. B33 TaxID=2942131 RepID=UPI00234233F9|nr:hypothetical protein [Actinomyces sp. B33]MDC4232788.1 hypothetical protein [Actinomyces sp. B33]
MDIDIDPSTNGLPGINQLSTIVGAVMTIGLIGVTRPVHVSVYNLLFGVAITQVSAFIDAALASISAPETRTARAASAEGVVDRVHEVLAIVLPLRPRRHAASLGADPAGLRHRTGRVVGRPWPPDGSWAADTYAELIERAGPAGERPDIMLSLSLDMKAAARQIRIVVGGIRGPANILRQEMNALVAALRSADLAPSPWLTSGQITVILCSACDPAIAAALECHHRTSHHPSLLRDPALRRTASPSIHRRSVAAMPTGLRVDGGVRWSGPDDRRRGWDCAGG